jgi:hypothetical protein
MTPTPSNLTDIINLFTNIGLKLIPLLGAIAFLAFVWGVARFIRAAGNEKEIKDSKNFLIWGVIGLFVLVTIWGIITFLRGEFGFNDVIGIPQIHF